VGVPNKQELELNGRQRSVSKTCQHENGPTNHSCILRLFWSVVRANVQTVWKSAFFGSCPVNLPCQHGCLRIGAVGCIFQCRRQTKFILASDEEHIHNKRPRFHMLLQPSCIHAAFGASKMNAHHPNNKAAIPLEQLRGQPWLERARKRMKTNESNNSLRSCF
jgi:hypothetical protein